MTKTDDQRYQEAVEELIANHEIVIGNIAFPSELNSLVRIVDKKFPLERFIAIEICFYLGIMIGKKMERAKRHGTINP